MWEQVITAVIPAVVGLLGVVVGAYTSAHAIERTSIRRGAVSDARLAREGLGRWLQAIDVIQKAPLRLADKGSDYDMYLAIELHSAREHLGDSWWREHGTKLVSVTTREQWDHLIGASWATDGLLMLIDSIGDAGNEAVERRVAMIAARQERSSPVDEDDTFRKLHELLDDHRLFVVRGVANSVIGAREKFQEAVEVCEVVDREYTSNRWTHRHRLGIRDKASDVGDTTMRG
jgi:hypothetical protein